MRSDLYGIRKGHKNRTFIQLVNSLLQALPGVGSRLLKSKIKIRFLCPLLGPYKPDFISKHLYQNVCDLVIIISKQQEDDNNSIARISPLTTIRCSIFEQQQQVISAISRTNIPWIKINLHPVRQEP